MESNTLFVYGTLRREFSNPWAHRLRQQAQYLGMARMQGELYRIDSYPGLIESAEQDAWVSGELYQIQHSGLLRCLDQYENCQDSSGEYIRRCCPVWLGTQRLMSWVYLYNRDLCSRHRIVTGDFAASLSARP